MTRGPLVLREIVAVRIRAGWFGRPVLQVCRNQCRMRFHADGSPYWERVGEAWHDAKKRDLLEAHTFTSRALSGLTEE